MKFLQGKKTFLLTIIAGVVFVGARLGYITPEIEAQLYTILGIGTVATFRSAIK